MRAQHTAIVCGCIKAALQHDGRVTASAFIPENSTFCTEVCETVGCHVMCSPAGCVAAGNVLELQPQLLCFALCWPGVCGTHDCHVLTFWLYQSGVSGKLPELGSIHMLDAGTNLGMHHNGISVGELRLLLPVLLVAQIHDCQLCGLDVCGGHSSTKKLHKLC